jgi:outer membrane lipoprotein-sorting protein
MISPLLLLLRVSLSAFAAEEDVSFYLETAPSKQKAELAEADALARSSQLNTRVVRRFVGGEGWCYLLIAEGYESEVTAGVDAAKLANLSHLDVTLYRQQGKAAVSVRTAPGSPRILEPTPGAPAQVGDDPVKKILDDVSEALGGVDGGVIALHKSSSVRFEYVREVPHQGQPIVAEHVYLRDGSRVRLDVVVKGGPASSSTTVIDGAVASVLIDGKVSPRDAERTREVMAEYAPEGLLSYPLRFVSLVDGDPSHVALQLVGEERVNGEPCVILESKPEGEGSAVPGLRLAVSSKDWRPRQVIFTTSAGVLLYEYSDWSEVSPGVVVPMRVEVTREGTLVERLEVRSMTLPATIAPDTFTLPTTPAK